jgi:hypothetical protein
MTIVNRKVTTEDDYQVVNMKITSVVAGDQISINEFFKNIENLDIFPITSAIAIGGNVSAGVVSVNMGAGSVDVFVRAAGN